MGGYVALVAASDEKLACKIAAYLKIFDDMYDSNENVNLKG